jgi:type IV fimbrial biogenesis protein FimT
MRQNCHKQPQTFAVNLTVSQLSSGFSMVELVVVVALMMIMSAYAIPQIMLTIRGYQLTSSASQVADAIKFSRFEAIRRNVNVNCLAAPSGTTWTVGTDSNGDGTLENTERQFQLSNSVNFLPTSSVPGANSLPAALNVASVTTLSASSSTQTISFDPRGAVYFPTSAGGVTTVYVYYVGSTSSTTQDYRAVVVMPSGPIQIWAGGQASGWRQLN